MINPDAFLGFGVGPRACIGSRFGLMEMKAFLYHLVLNFSLHVVENTQIPIKLLKSFGNVRTEKGIHVGLKGRPKLNTD